MLQRLWNFAKRHRKKLIAGAAITGGAYVAWRVLLPRLQRRLLERLLQEIQESTKDQETPSTRRRSRFDHQQQVADSFARRNLADLRTRLNACFSVEECSRQLQEATTREEKSACFQALQLECMAKVAAALYVLHAHLLLHRVAFNIVGRELSDMDARSADAGAGSRKEDLPGEVQAELQAHTDFLTLTFQVQEHLAQRVAETVRSATRAVIESAGTTPATPVTAESLSRHLQDICRRADEALLVQASSASTLLPDVLSERVPELHAEQVTRLLDDARDGVEHPVFLKAFEVVSIAAATRLANLLGDGAADATVAPLAGGRSSPLGKLFGQLVAFSNQVFDADGIGGDFVVGFAEELGVRDFCELLYFRDDGQPRLSSPQ